MSVALTASILRHSEFHPSEPLPVPSRLTCCSTLARWLPFGVGWRAFYHFRATLPAHRQRNNTWCAPDPALPKASPPRTLSCRIGTVAVYRPRQHPWRAAHRWTDVSWPGRHRTWSCRTWARIKHGEPVRIQCGYVLTCSRPVPPPLPRVLGRKPAFCLDRGQTPDVRDVGAGGSNPLSPTNFSMG